MITRIVIGFDGSAHATNALRWAVEEAALHGAVVQVALVTEDLEAFGLGQGGDDGGDTDPALGNAKAALNHWVEEAVGPDAGVEQRVIYDYPVHGLIHLAGDDGLLVVGARGVGGFQGLLLGSVSERVAEHAPGPVVVVGAEAPVHGGRVVVGVDGSDRSLDALRWAVAEARVREGGLDVVHAWRLPVMATSPWTIVPDYSEMRTGGRELLDRAMAAVDHDGIEVKTTMELGSATEALLDHAVGAGLVVVGSRGLGRFSQVLLGSVTRQLVHHAPCPVVII
ncbi:MAG: universal stress protein [Aquihabitans sp.]